MMDDIRYSEMLFLQAVLNRKLELFHPSTVDSLNSFKIRPEFFLGMVESLLEEMYVSFDHYPHQELVWRLRREHVAEWPDEIPQQDWNNDFGPINKNFGHDAGDEVMKAYLIAVRDAVGLLGDAYRVGGDETATIIVGQGRQRAREIANDIWTRVRSLKIEYKGQILPGVTASVGVATSPPAPRSRDVHTMAEAFQRKAKELGKDRVVDG
ncbi:MAG: diguanylate cyclase [Blastocatellia bacterium]